MQITEMDDVGTRQRHDIRRSVVSASFEGVTSLPFYYFVIRCSTRVSAPYDRSFSLSAFHGLPSLHDLDLRGKLRGKRELRETRHADSAAAKPRLDPPLSS